VVCFSPQRAQRRLSQKRKSLDQDPNPSFLSSLCALRDAVVKPARPILGGRSLNAYAIAPLDLARQNILDSISKHFSWRIHARISAMDFPTLRILVKKGTELVSGP
jgi:hypothetical protein